MNIDRNQQLDRLKKETFDLVVIGGGATGSGIAFDAALRGYKVALIDSGDFAGQTSSRSTKLLHGGVRYLEKAFKEFDFSQFSLVKSGLKERSTVLKIAPHLSRPLPILIPVSSWFQAGYYWMGIKVYDLLSWSHTIGKSRFISKEEVEKYFPAINADQLKGAIMYFDGQFDDARLNVSLAVSTIHEGGVAANYVKVVDFQHLDGKLTGALVEDQVDDDSWVIKAKVFVNATGPFADKIRRMDNPSLSKMMVGSIGTHIVLNKSYAPKSTGLLIPKTSDGRVLFLLPWENQTLVGTTDLPVDIQRDPQTSDEEVEYLIEHLKKYLGLEVAPSDVLAKWSGIRPLVSEKNSSKTAKLSRDFTIEKSASGLYSIMGGKWTSYRKMGEKLVDRMIQDGELPKHECQTAFTPVVGGEVPWEGMFDQLDDFDGDVQEHLYRAYGTKCVDVATLASRNGLKKRLHPDYPYIEAEVVWAVQQEMAINEEDVLLRRVRLMMLDEKAGEHVKARVSELIMLAKGKTARVPN